MVGPVDVWRSLLAEFADEARWGPPLWTAGNHKGYSFDNGNGSTLLVVGPDGPVIRYELVGVSDEALR